MKLIKKIISLATENDIKIQEVARAESDSDTGAFMISNSGIKTVNISIPVRYTHTPVQLASLNDIESTDKLLNLLLKSQEI